MRIRGRKRSKTFLAYGSGLAVNCHVPAARPSQRLCFASLYLQRLSYGLERNDKCHLQSSPIRSTLEVDIHATNRFQIEVNQSSKSFQVTVFNFKNGDSYIHLYLSAYLCRLYSLTSM